MEQERERDHGMQEEILQEDECTSRKQMPIHKVVIVCLTIIVAMLVTLMVQQSMLNNLKVKEAYAISVLISLQEESLVLQGYLPSDVGLSYLRQKWIDNPCIETAMEYNEALSEVLEFLKTGKKKEPDVWLNVDVLVQV